MPRARPDRLVNTAAVEVLPAHLFRARDNRSARQLAQSTWLLRRKRDGRYLASTARAQGRDWLVPLHGQLDAGDGSLDAALRALALERQDRRRAFAQPLLLSRTAQPVRRPALLPLEGLERRLAELGIDADAYADTHQLALVPEPAELALAGYDRYHRPLFLLPGAARAWRALQAAAAVDGIALHAISGYRSHDYQLGIFRRKRARGQSVADILRVNTAPGWSEHHSGRALDVGTAGEPPAEETFESTPAFAWLEAHAPRHGFVLSYPRDNPHGIVYEPWHWCWRGG